MSLAQLEVVVEVLELNIFNGTKGRSIDIKIVFFCCYISLVVLDVVCMVVVVVVVVAVVMSR